MAVDHGISMTGSRQVLLRQRYLPARRQISASWRRSAEKRVLCLHRPRPRCAGGSTYVGEPTRTIVVMQHRCV